MRNYYCGGKDTKGIDLKYSRQIYGQVIVFIEEREEKKSVLINQNPRVPKSIFTRNI